MPKRNLPQARIDETVFPVRVTVFVPDTGFGAMLGPLFGWLDAQCGPTGYAWHGGPGVAGRDTVAIYFRRAEDPGALVAAWPALELADGTGLARYDHPREGELERRQGAGIGDVATGEGETGGCRPPCPPPGGGRRPPPDLPREYLDLCEDQQSGAMRPRPRK